MDGLPLSVKFAIGNDVSVNVILGTSFIKSAKMKIDFNNDVISSELLNSPPFAISYKQPSRGMPNIVNAEANSTSTLHIKSNINKLEKYFGKEKATNRAMKIALNSAMSSIDINSDDDMRIDTEGKNQWE